MKLIHTSDIHIDSPLTAKLSTEKIRERRRELLLNFARLTEEAKRLGASGIIIAGDLFDSEKISKRAISTALDVIESNPSIAYFYLYGNHEKKAISESGIELPKNLYIFGEDWTYFEFGNVIVSGRGECTADMFKTLRVSPEKKNIVVLHGELRDRSASPDVIGKNDARDLGIDYLALGHYHSYSEQMIDRRAVAVYSGTPEGRGFDEVGKRGFVLIDTDGDTVRHTFVSFAKRRLHEIEVDITDALRTSEIEERARARLIGVPADDLVRLTLVGSYTPNLWKDTEALKRVFLEKYYYFEVKDSSRLEINPEIYKNDKSLKGEFIRLVSGDATLSDRQKEKIISLGVYALMGEEYYGD